MPASLFDPAARACLLDRIGCLTSDSLRQWGRMSLPEMLAHCDAQLRMAMGEVPAKALRTPFKVPGVRQLIVYVMPWPKGAPTAPELKAPPVADVEFGKTALRAEVERFAAKGPGFGWAVHPAFGRLSGRAWGVLAWRHLDHHLRQFGV